jgi:hypothetical protein
VFCEESPAIGDSSLTGAKAGGASRVELLVGVQYSDSKQMHQNRSDETLGSFPGD